MQRIHFILFKYLRSEAHYQYLSLFDDLLHRFPAAMNAVASCYGDFALLLAQEKQVTDARRSSDYTAQIAAADHRDDRLLVGIRDLVDVAVRHFNPATAEAARSLQNRLKTFGDVISKSYEEEAAAVTILTEELQSAEYAAKAALVGITEWVNELTAAVADFKNLLQLRSAEQAGKPPQRLREVRREIEKLYRLMTGRIASADTLDETGIYTEFINELNVQVDYFNDHNHHPAPKDLKAADVDPVPVQQYTGKPVTPIPVVYLDGQELSFAKHFTLTYKNNVNRGVAEISILGKGEYRGRKTVTFNVIKS